DEPLGSGQRSVLEKIARLTARDDEPSQRYESERINHEQLLAQKQACAEHVTAAQQAYESLREDLSAALKCLHDDDGQSWGGIKNIEL
ncbi:hypothetical protein GGI21_005529, partial [Coemansia aciculifera]